ncbi:TPA: hypothetical protein JG819_004692 [Vibrio parahaemolyticus]|nr:hypothetical protein [Vibrio parahaemolyticus]HAV1545592.1 hypothetical protein [Vibrio parahaemolyticus]
MKKILLLLSIFGLQASYVNAESESNLLAKAMRDNAFETFDGSGVHLCSLVSYSNMFDKSSPATAMMAHNAYGKVSRGTLFMDPTGEANMDPSKPIILTVNGRNVAEFTPYKDNEWMYKGNLFYLTSRSMYWDEKYLEQGNIVFKAPIAFEHVVIRAYQKCVDSMK